MSVVVQNFRGLLNLVPRILRRLFSHNDYKHNLYKQIVIRPSIEVRGLLILHVQSSRDFQRVNAFETVIKPAKTEEKKMRC